MKQVIRGALVALLSALVGHSVFAASSEIGVVLMHGKWGSSQSMLPLARDLESRGYLVSNAEMPWSGRRLYDAAPVPKQWVEVTGGHVYAAEKDPAFFDYVRRFLVERRVLREQ